ncbi:MAG: hypothetical protein QM831_35085 [Kofleriaceae bacterium]
MRFVLAVMIAAVLYAAASAQEAPSTDPPVAAPPPVDAGVVDASPSDAPQPVPNPEPPTIAPAIHDRATSRNFAGSVQLDYLAAQHRQSLQDSTFEGGTVELSLKLAMDLGDHVTANVKVCYACHGFEVGMAYFDLRAADELNIRVGRFSPSFGGFPLRHDPANHSTSDKPLAYDMGRMVRMRDWNEGVLPAPWVDNGVEVNGSHFVGPLQIDYAAYAISGPKGDATTGDFDFTLSRSGDNYYVDNNSEPAVGGRLALTFDLAPRQLLTLGGSVMTGHYDPKAQYQFTIAGADATLQLGRTFVRAEWLARWTRFDVGTEPLLTWKYGPTSAGYSNYFYKDGYDFELEQPIGRVMAIARFDGLRRSGNVLATSQLSDQSTVERFTVGLAIKLVAALQLKVSVERYLFSDFPDENAAHLGIAGPF